MHYLLRTALATFSVLLMVAAHAEPITINIPVNLSNMHPDVQRVMVYCRINDETGRSIDEARTLTSTPIVNGNYSGTLTAVGGTDPSIVSKAHSYRCFLQFSVAGAPGVHKPDRVPGESYSSSDYITERLARDTSAPFQHYIEDNF